MDNNPNMIDSLFVSQRCVLHCSPIGDLVRQNRKLFLHKGIFFKLKGYSYSQLHKMRIKKPEGLDEILKFEDNLAIPHTTTIQDVEKELKRRNLLKDENKA